MDVAAWLVGVEPKPSRHGTEHPVSADNQHGSFHGTRDPAVDLTRDDPDQLKWPRHVTSLDHLIARPADLRLSGSGHGNKRSSSGCDAFRAANTASQTSSHLYSRRRRHKTRLHRYVPRSQRAERSQAPSRRKPARDAKTRRKSRAIKVPDSSPRMASRRSRLTIEPGIVSGLFRHGKVSRLARMKRIDTKSQEAAFLDNPLDLWQDNGEDERFRISNTDQRDRALRQEQQLNDYFLDQQHVHGRHRPDAHPHRHQRQERPMRAESPQVARFLSEGQDRFNDSMRHSHSVNSRSFSSSVERHLEQQRSSRPCIVERSTEADYEQTTPTLPFIRINTSMSDEFGHEPTPELPPSALPRKVTKPPREYKASMPQVGCIALKEQEQHRSEGDGTNETTTVANLSSKVAHSQLSSSEPQRNSTTQDMPHKVSIERSTRNHLRNKVAAKDVLSEVSIREDRTSRTRSVDTSTASPLGMELDECAGISQALERHGVTDAVFTLDAQLERRHANEVDDMGRGNDRHDLLPIIETCLASRRDDIHAIEYDEPDFMNQYDSAIDEVHDQNMTHFSQLGYNYDRAMYEQADYTEWLPQGYDRYTDMSMGLTQHEDPLLTEFWKPNKLY